MLNQWSSWSLKVCAVWSERECWNSYPDSYLSLRVSESGLVDLTVFLVSVCLSVRIWAIWIGWPVDHWVICFVMSEVNCEF